MILVSLDNRSELLAEVRNSLVFGLNVLASHQRDVASNFARKGGSSKFAGVAWTLHCGVPRFPGINGFVACNVADLIEAGDYLLVLGHIRCADPSRRLPLTYHSRAFGTHSELHELFDQE